MKHMNLINHIGLATFFLFLPSMALSQNIDGNYARTVTSIDSLNTNTIESFQFYDGLGRPSLSATNENNSHGVFTYSLLEYDAKGQPSRKWLPAVGTPILNNHAEFASLSYGTYQDSYAYSEKKYDILGRIMTIKSPGEDLWSTNHNTKREYYSNGEKSVKNYLAISPGSGILQRGYYGASQLTVEKTVDEDGKSVEVFRNLLGNVLLERRDGDNDTYFVYDHQNLLRYVLSPMYQEKANLDAYAYKYEYDSKGRCVKKSIPGCEYVQYWYDKEGRLAYEQDGNARKKGVFRFYLYDAFGRMVVQGTCTQKATSSYLNTETLLGGQNTISITGYAIPYGNNMTGIEVESVNYYDRYSFLSDVSNKYHRELIQKLKTKNYNSTFALGKLTGHATATTKGELLFSATYYDKHGRISDYRRILPNNTFEQTQTEYSFTNKPVTIIQSLTKDNAIQTLSYKYEYYTANDQLKTVLLAYNDQAPVPIACYEYNNLGQVTKLEQGNHASVINYSYNVRGALKRIESDALNMTLYYTDGNGVPCYNGNISSVAYADGDIYHQFEYDGLNRLISSTDMSNGGYEEAADYSSCYSYDKNGNILSLQRKGMTHVGAPMHPFRWGKTDQLEYTYNGNQLIHVKDSITSTFNSNTFHYIDNTDEAAELEYDQNGNMTKDLNRNILSIEYNSLNLPVKIQFTKNRKTQYVYNSDGEKMKISYYTPYTISPFKPLNSQMSMVSTDDSTANSSILSGIKAHVSARPVIGKWDSLVYCGNFIYSKKTLEKILFDGGYITVDTAGLAHYYFYQRDHLGSVRAVVNETGDETESNFYYPFGAQYFISSSEKEIQRNRFNGKEFDHFHGLNEYDYGARWYDPILARFTTVDPLCEKYYNISPYAYCANNPVNAVDPDGKTIYVVYYQGGKTHYYIFDGTIGKIPNNPFVLDFIEAYNYNRKNGGGDNMYKAATDPKLKIFVKDATKYQNIKKRTTEYDWGGENLIIRWESRKGLLTTEGGHQSPATRLEHEFAHAENHYNNSQAYRKRRDNKKVGSYGNEEEKYVIKGAEAKTAKANGEDIRRNHFGTTYDVISSFSTTPLYK